MKFGWNIVQDNLDKWRIQINIFFLISPLSHMLWCSLENIPLNAYKICFGAEIEITPFIWRYDGERD